MQARNVGAVTYLKNFTGQRDGTGFPGNDKNLSRDRGSGKNGKLQSLFMIGLMTNIFMVKAI